MLRKKDPLVLAIDQILISQVADELEPVHKLPGLQKRVWDGWYDRIMISDKDDACCRVCEARVPVQDAQFCYINLFAMSPGTFLCDSCYHMSHSDTSDGAGGESGA